MNRTVRSLLAGIAGGAAGTIAMDLVSVAWSFARRRSVTESEASLFQHGGRPDVEEAKEHRKSSTDSETVATTNIAERIGSTILARPLTPEERHRGGQIVHYAYGTMLGAAYGYSAARCRAVRSGHGVLYGVGMGLAGFGVVLPALHLSKPPQQYSAAQHAFSIISHAAYGAALESVRGLIDGRAH